MSDGLTPEILIIAGGTGGDVYPLIGIGKGLQERGWPVVFMTNAYFEPIARRAGLEFVPLATAEEHQNAMEDPEIWQAGAGFKFIFAEMARKAPLVYEAIAQRYVPGKTIVIATWMALGARLAQEKLGVPLVTVQLYALFRSQYEQPGLNLPPFMKPVIRPLRQLLMAALDQFAFDPILAPPLNSFRAQLGLPPIRRVFKDWIFSPDMVIGLFPSWFATPQPDWPPNTHLAGFPLYDVVPPEIPFKLEQFLRDGTPPIVFTWGTGMRPARTLAEKSVQVCRSLGRRGIILTPFPEHVPANLPDDVRHINFVSLKALLPKAAALVHHGGIGTVALAFAAGIPQLITPFNHDQPVNAARVRALGVGDSIHQRAYNAHNATKKLRVLIESSAIAEKCRTIKVRMEETDAIKNVCDLVEWKMAPQARRATHRTAFGVAGGR